MNIANEKEIQKQIFELYELAISNKITTFHKNSSLAYQLLMELCTISLKQEKKAITKIDSIKEYIDQNFYQQTLNLDELADYAEISKYDEIFEPYLFHELGKALKKYYYKQEDLGRSMYEKMDSGDYGEFRYSKQLIGIYKNISSTMMAGIALQQNDEELFEEQIPWLKSFSSSIIQSTCPLYSRKVSASRR